MNVLLTLLFLVPTADTPAKKKQAGDALFGSSKVVSFQLTADAKDWANLQPAGGGMGFFGGPGGPGGPPRPPAADKHRNTFGVDFPWGKADLTFGGKTYKDVGVRYKGNYTYTASRGLKKSLKIDFDKHVDQQLDGLKKFNFNCGVSDPSMVREALSFAFFRAAGVPAPRTAFAELTLTLPGKYDKEYVGLFTLVEQVNKGFLERHFKDGKGMLLKPEGLQGGMSHLGDDWKAYEARYRPKDEPTAAQKKRLIDFTRLIDKGDDAAFAKGIGSYLDVDAFLRFVAANALLSNLDSYLGFGHNFYLYLVPGTDKFAFIPWDCDLSLAAWPAVGTPEQLVELSVMHPHAGNNKLIDRLLAIRDVSDRYRKFLGEMAAGPFAKEKLLKELDAQELAVKEPMAKEKKAVAARKEGGGGFGFGPPGGGAFGASLLPRAFVEKRVKSVAAQLDGKDKGFLPRSFGFGPPGGGPPPGPPGNFGPRVGEVMPGPVQDQLKLTADQKRKLAELQKEVEETIQKILDDEQKAALKRMRESRPGGPGFGPPRP